MGNLSWTHLIIAILIIVFTALGPIYSWLVIILAAVIAILSIFGVCSCGSKHSTYRKKEISPAPKKKKRK